MKKICEQCGVEFLINEKLKRERNKRFCCGTCAKRHNGLLSKNRTYSIEINKTKGLKGELNAFYGKKHTQSSLTKMSESSLWKEEKYRYCVLSENEQEIFKGLLISDGCLEKSSRISSRLTFGFKFKEILEKIITDLSSIKFSNIYEYKSKPHKITSKSYINFWLKSNNYHNFLEEYNKWYIDKIKIIPFDLKISSLMCYWWYICDGYNSNNNVYLCTDSFTNNDNKKLIKKFNENNFYPTLTSQNRLFFDKEESIKFLNWIIIHNENINIYNYKFKI